MDYLIPKLLTHMAMPLGAGSILIGAGILVSTFGYRGLGIGLSLGGLSWIWLWAAPVVSDWARLSLEKQYPSTAVEALPTADAIVVLGGDIEGITPERLFPDLSAAADRTWHAARLFHRGKAPLIILVGGRPLWDAHQGPEADAMLRFLTDLGVPQDKVRMERHSRNTYENARETRRLLIGSGLNRILLVTSAYHMRRAQAVFHAAGIQTIPAATDHEVDNRKSTLLDFLPNAGALENSTIAWKEYLGFQVYRWRGWIASPHAESKEISEQAGVSTGPEGRREREWARNF